MTEQTTLESWGSGARETGHLCKIRRSTEQRNSAAQRGITEAELVGGQVGTNAVRLRADWVLTLHRLGSVGPVTSLTGNDHASIEGPVVYRNIATKGQAAQVSEGDADLCFFLSEWRAGFAVTEEGCLGLLRSLQFFDGNGAAVHKVYLREDSNIGAFDELVDRQASQNQSPGNEERADSGRRPAHQTLETGDPEAGDGSLRVIQSIAIDRPDVVTGTIWSERVARASFRRVLESANVSKTPLLTMVGNHGAIQIHSGPVGTLRPIEGGFAIDDPLFSLQVDERGIASAWVVRKITSDGVATSLELYDRTGEMVVSLARL